MIIKGAKALLPGQEDLREVDISIEAGKIAEIMVRGSDQKDREIIDARGLWILPGGIDPHVHFDDPGYTEREDFFHGCCAAASGGITTVIDMPCTSVPPVTDRRNLRQKLEVIEQKAVVDFGLYGGVCAQSFTSQSFAPQSAVPKFILPQSAAPKFISPQSAGLGLERNMEELAETVLGFKTYFISGMESFSRLDHYQFKLVLEISRELGLPVLLHAEDYDYIQAATVRYMKEGNGPSCYYHSRPEIAETLAVLSAVEIAEETGADLHIVHIGTARVGELLKNNRITGETGPHYLQFDLADFERMGAVLKCTPPVKGPENKERLWQQLADHTLSFVASDHAPCRKEGKHTGSIWTDYSGIPGCGTMLPYMFSEGFMKGRISLRRLGEVTSEGAARRYGIYHRKGSIETGKDADLVLIDPNGSWVVRGKEFYSKGKVTPFEGMKFDGRIVKTILRGKIIYTSEEGVVGQAGYGELVKPDG